MMNEKNHDVIIVGGGITGTALLYVLEKYTNLSSILLIEKHHEFAQAASHSSNNSQTLHFGDIETNYTLEKAKKVKTAADMVKAFLDTHGDDSVFKVFPKMVLAIGEKEVEELKARYEDFKELFPELEVIGPKRIAEIEPSVVKDRDPTTSLLALYTPVGYTVNFSELAKLFTQKATQSNKVTTSLGDLVYSTVKNDDGTFTIKCKNGTHRAKTVIFAAGAYSLVAAKSMGYGEDLIVLPVAGSFFYTPALLNGKVYTMQTNKLPFAAVHGDPDLCDLNKSRFGPTARVYPLFERGYYRSFIDLIKIFNLRIDSVKAMFKIISEPVYFKFTIRNLLYDIPYFGKYFYLHNVKKIIPSIKASQVKRAKGIGGVRAQTVDRKTGTIKLGEAKIVGDNIIFNITPSPGASTCLQNALDDTRQIINFLGPDYLFDYERFKTDFVAGATD